MKNCKIVMEKYENIKSNRKISKISKISKIRI